MVFFGNIWSRDRYPSENRMFRLWVALTAGFEKTTAEERSHASTPVCGLYTVLTVIERAAFVFRSCFFFVRMYV